jgi:DNA-directed RNA polymerase subunit RPC12/RpoP
VRSYREGVRGGDGLRHATHPSATEPRCATSISSSLLSVFSLLGVVERSEFDAMAKRLDLCIDFLPGGTFACPECGGKGCKAYDTAEKTWRHLNFFQHEAYLHVRTPRVRCERCGLKLVDVPWGPAGQRVHAAV